LSDSASEDCSGSGTANNLNMQQQMMQQQLTMQQAAYVAQMQQQQLAKSLNQAYASMHMQHMCMYGTMRSQYWQYHAMMATSANLAHIFNPATCTKSLDSSALLPQVKTHAMATNSPLVSPPSPAYPLAFPHQPPSAVLASITTVAIEGASKQLHQKGVDRRERERARCHRRRLRKRQQRSALLAGNQLLAASIAQHGRSRDALEDELTELRCAVLKRGKALQLRVLVAKRKH